MMNNLESMTILFKLIKLYSFTHILKRIINSNGIKTVDNLPIPLSTSLIDTVQKIPHNINVQIRVGNSIVVAEDKFELPPT